jgi:zinc protease
VEGELEIVKLREDNDSVMRTTLSNGLTVLCREMHHAPVAGLWVWYRVGSRNEVPGITGISHWVEHMLFKGTPNFPQGEIDRLIAREGGTFNGMTWIDFTTYYETLPSDRFDLALRLEADRMVNSLFDPEEVASERTVIISEREGAENFPQFLLAEEVTSSAFKVHPYHHEVVGWKCDLEQITREDLYRHYRTYYGPNNAILVAAGDFHTDALLGRIDELYGKISPAGPIPPIRATEPPQQGERRVVVRGQGETAYVQIAFHAPNARHSDFFPLVILDTILSGAKSMSLWGSTPSNKSSRLYQALVDTELASDVSSSYSPTVDPYLFTCAATVRANRTPEEVEAALLSELTRIAQEPVSPEELEKAIRQSRAQFVYSSESVTNQGFWLGFAEIVASYEWFRDYLESLSKVTAEDVQRVARSYLSEDNRTVGCYLPAGTERR